MSNKFDKYKAWLYILALTNIITFILYLNTNKDYNHHKELFIQEFNRNEELNKEIKNLKIIPPNTSNTKPLSLEDLKLDDKPKSKNKQKQKIKKEPIYRVGALCRDGWESDATGRGACSHHGGVRCWRYSDGSCR